MININNQELNKIKQKAIEEKIPIIMDDTLEIIEKYLKDLKPKRILEIGTAVGYSAICFSKFLLENGKIDTIERDEKRVLEAKENIKKAFIRGVFLGSGTINNPKNKYHLEIIFRKMEFAQTSIEILKEFGIALKILNTSERYSLYTKDGEEISKFLAFIGASSSVLKFEEIRVYRDMRNNINRIVNCETANLSKTVNAAVKQIEAINKLKENGKFAKLPDTLKELAELRVENPESSLTELGKMLKSPIGKSGVNHRLQAILKIAEEE